MLISKSFILFIDRINKMLFWITSSMLAIIFALVISQVFFRYILNNSLSWTAELSKFLVIWIVFLGTSLSIREKSIIAVEVIIQFVPKRVKFILEMIIFSISTLFFIYLLIYGMTMALQVGDTKSIALNMPMWIPYAAIPVGATFMILNTIVVIIESIQEKGKIL